MLPARAPCLQVSLLLAVVVSCSAADPRPTHEEWKKTEAAKKAKEDEAEAKEDKMAAVSKVITLLDKLKEKVLAEGEEEAKSYNKFSCFCKDGQREKTKDITEGKDAQATLSAEITKLADGRKEDDTTITNLEKDIETLEKEMKTAEEESAKALKTYTAEKEDLSAAIDSINDALKALKASRASASLLQLKSAAASVRTALAMADALGLGVDTMQGSAAVFLQEAPKVEMEDYKFHSDSVIETIEGLLKKFREKKAKSDADEVQRVQEFDTLMQEKTDTLKAKNLELSQTQKSREEKIAKIGLKSQELSTVSADLLDDQSYLEELYTICKNKAATWDQRVKVRTDELSALTAAGVIIKGAVSKSTAGSTLRFAQLGVSVGLAKVVARNEDAMDQIEAAAENEEAPTHAAPAFLQRRSVSRHQDPDAGREEVVKLLRAKGSQLSSTLLTSLASQIDKEKDPFKKVKTLIEELITRLQAQAAAEATQKGWCDKSMADAEQKKTTTAQEIRDLNDNMAELEAQIDLLKEELAKLKEEIKDLKDAQTEADTVRKEEKAQNEKSIAQAEEGKAAVEQAMNILEKFYKGAAEEKVDLTLLQGPKDDAPDAGFKSGEAYKGDSAGAEGVMGMLEVVKSDFARTIKETQKAEDEAEQDHKTFTAETTASIKSKEDSETAKKKEKSDAEASFDTDEESLKKKTDLLKTTIEELLELKKTCVDTGMSYEERVERREEEIASLRKALCILSAYDAYGPNAAKYDQCSGPY
mmetsp:Transcript_16818/g.26732  ORF Transcript_16818/g.26732 Transcript_16818/m.26732 type:complete len:759 (+) Transcript_16818:65-2341(+)